MKRLCCLSLAFLLGFIAHASSASVLEELMPAPVSIERSGGAAVPVAQLSTARVERRTVPDAPLRVAAESYSITVAAAGVTVTARDERGERHAKATLAQLAALAGEAGTVPACTITDWPRFPVRGLMVDCGRNYQSLESLEAILDLMAAYKLNTFHWHLTDQFGWRLESKRHPELQRAEAFGRDVGRFYTQAEFRGLLASARRRGITVIPELDVPGHTLAFRKGLGIDKMNSPGVDRVVCELIDELCSLAPPDEMPYVHLGTDEVRAPSERIPDDWYLLWGRRVAENGRTLIGWSPGHAMDGVGGYVRDVWGWAERPVDGTREYLDSTMMYYINHVDPLELLSAAAYQQPCRFGGDESAKLGAMIGVWHDDALSDHGSLARETALAPAVVLLSDAFWRGRGSNMFHYFGRLPPHDRPEFAIAADLERRTIAHRDKVFAKSAWAFPFVRQTQLRWRMTDLSDGRTVNANIAQATVYPNHFRFPRSWYVNKPSGRVALETWVKSPCDQTVGAWVGFTAFSRSSGRAAEGGVQAAGEWNRHGSTLEVNGERIAAPNWKNAGVADGVSEVPLADEEYYLREPLPVRLKAGWNHVRLTLDKHLAKTWKWVGTFVPVAGTTAHPREVPGLQFSASPPFDLPESVFADAPFSPVDLGTATYRRLAAADAAADAAWNSVGSVAEYDARRAQMRDRLVALMGGFPERTPLDAKTVARIERDGYSVEKLYFMSRPGMPVTALLFLPDPARFRGPYPAVCVACGHDSRLGKLNPGYQRGCILAAKAGIAALIYDPIAQGERGQVPRTMGTTGHNTIGVRELLIGRSMAMTRIWDGMRAIDYLESRPEIDAGRIGFMGNSGGGTLSAYMTAFDPRVKAGAPSCYISSLRAVCREIGPQDAEQDIFGQLSVGFNHAGLLLLNANSVCVNVSTGDFFPIDGSRESFRVAKGVADRIGRGDALALVDVPGPHGWKESSRTASILWMRRWLRGESDALPLDLPALRALDVSFNPKTADMGLGAAEGLVSKTGEARDLPGFRSYFDILNDELDELEAARRGRKRPFADELRSLAKIPSSSDYALDATVVSRASLHGGERQSVVFTRADGAHLPAVLLLPESSPGGAALFVGDIGRGEWTADAKRYLDAGKAVLIADLSGFGEAPVAKRWYAYQGQAADGAAVMLNLMGENMVALRAGEILGLAEHLKEVTGKRVELCAAGDAVIPAVHAVACGSGLFWHFSARRHPPSWRTAFRDAAAYGGYPFANVVPGALRRYDWPDLL